MAELPMRLRIFSLVYGEKYIRWLRKTSVSLGWPRNRKALDGALWRIYTVQEHEKEIREILRPIDLDLVFHFVDFNEVIWKQSGGGHHRMLVHELGLCVEDSSALFVAPPDIVFGEGTIETIVRLGAESPDCCVSVAHPRVVAETFPDLNEPVSNARLVKLAMEHLHPAFRASDMTLEENSVFFSGNAWRKLHDNLYAITCRIPTPHLVRPKKEDVEFLMANSFGSWDHTWPEQLVKEQRQRVVGSSDAAFMVELTHADQHSLRKQLRVDTELDIYKRNLEHHKVNRNLVTIWRAE